MTMMALPPPLPTSLSELNPTLGTASGSSAGLGRPSGSISRSDRPPTLSFPSLHLGSFNTLNVDAFPSPPLSGKPSIGSTLSSPGQAGGDWPRTEGVNGGSGVGGEGLRPVQPRRRESSQGSDHLAASSTLHPVRSIESSRSSVRSRGHLPPPLPPPTIGLPPLPILSPISPLDSLSPNGSTFGASHPQPPMRTSSSQRSGGSGDQGLPTLNNRSLGAPLSVNIPPPADFLNHDKNGSGSSAVLKDSPGIPRRRTLVEGTRNDRVAEVRLSKVMDKMDLSPKEQGSPESKRRPEPQDYSSETPPSPTIHKLEKKASTNNLKASPTSPTTKRSLPRPPISTDPSYDTPAKSGPSTQQSQQATPGMTPRANNQSFSRTPVVKLQQQQTMQSRNTNSASALPVIAGLADAGPYPSSRPTSIKGQQGTIGRGQPQRPIQEEICLECMMRDRDLADVDVSGEGAWGRASDGAWEDAKSREEELVHSLGGYGQARYSDSMSGDERLSASPPSTNNSMEEAEVQRRAVRRKDAAGRSKRREMDQRVVQEIGWRGFKWEEGVAGEGLPRAFRGNRGGPLTEAGIKAVMTKFPSASAHRYNSLQTYLRHQYMLVQEIAAEAKRIGFFPAPVEMIFSSATSHEAYMPSLAATGSRTSSLMWDNNAAIVAATPRRSGEQVRGVTFPPTPSGLPSLVRPSPSSPAELSMAIRAPRTVPLQRPSTQFIPDREPAPVASRQKLHVQTTNYNSTSLSPAAGPGGPGSRDRWAAGADPGDELWPPISPAESGMRPFSFAVRAGAVADRGSDSGHGRRSIFGRWGGSVTSFFGGSQGGSGSMMDMHLGLDSDRRNQASSQYIHSQPRAVSLASPTRPSFFSRDSRASSSDRDRAERTAKSMSNSRLSQMLKSEEEEPAPISPKKGKGFKGLLKKMKPKSRKSLNASTTVASSPYQPDPPVSSRHQQQQYYQQTQQPTYPQFQAQQTQSNSQLQPPPSLSYLSGQGDGRHNRNRSGSSSSMITDSQASLGGPPGIRRDSAAGLNSGMRSVSAPFAGSSSGGSPNTSPTSSRYDRLGAGNGRRESYASLSNRRGSGFENDLARESIVEVLSGQGQHRLPRQYDDRYDPAQKSNGIGNGNPNNYQSYSQPSHRPHNKTTSSLSASSVVETPPPLHINTVSGNYFSSQPGKSGPIANHQRVPSAQLSPNRFKNLPPLPPPGSDTQHTTLNPGAPLYQPSRPPQTGRYMDNFKPPRASFDQNPTRERERQQSNACGNPSPRLAQSMYAQTTGGGSMASLGSYNPGNGLGQRYGMSNGEDTFGPGGRQGQMDRQGQWGYQSEGQGNGVETMGSQGKGTAGRRGIKGLFGKAGRMA